MHEEYYPQNMEELNQQTGYIFYRTTLPKDSPKECLRLIDARDRAQVFLDHHFVTTQYQFEIGEDIFIEQNSEKVNWMFWWKIWDASAMGIN